MFQSYPNLGGAPYALLWSLHLALGTRLLLQRQRVGTCCPAQAPAQAQPPANTAAPLPRGPQTTGKGGESSSCSSGSQSTEGHRMKGISPADEVISEILLHNQPGPVQQNPMPSSGAPLIPKESLAAADAILAMGN